MIYLGMVTADNNRSDFGNVWNGETVSPGRSFGNVWPGGSVRELRDPGFGGVGSSRKESLVPSPDGSYRSPAAVMYLANRTPNTPQGSEPHQSKPAGKS